MRKTPNHVRNLRRARTMNQSDFARLVHISQQSLSKIERGLLHPRPDVQGLIAAVLGVSRADVFPPPDDERLAS
jgi:DNA-binding XRE family transcriptional regulator